MRNFYKLIILAVFVTSMCFLLYWKDYWKFPYFVWDENYHIASAAKYQKEVFFMEPHPPLGKLLIMLGEKALPINNGLTYGFENYDIIPHNILKPEVSFAGYRLFPTIAAILNILLLTAFAFWVSRSYIVAGAISTLPLLDTALITHSRTAMLDPFMVLGELLCIFAFLVLLRTPAEKRKSIWALSFLMSAGLVFSFMTKLFGLALLVLWPLLFYFRPELRKVFLKIFSLNFLFVLITSLGIWAVHFQLGKNVLTNATFNGTYYASSDYEKWLLGLEKDSWTHFPQKLWEHLRFMHFYETNVAILDVTDKNATGSFPLLWPFGSTPIVYRWEKGDTYHRYLYLIPNPWAWGVGLVSLILGIALWIRKGSAFIKENKEVTSLLVLYFSFFIPMLMISRVLYLYHYFPLLFVTWILALYLLHPLLKSSSESIKNRATIVALLVPLLCAHGYYKFRDIANFTPLSCEELLPKKVIPFWGLRFPTCDAERDKRRYLLQFKDAEP